ncbi:hypothetical protein LTR10_020886 [Elasticomyces elasticus]|uniref:Carboxymuconolactone decarboxylase-like domain-containing protein n=1 Tax=Exophiala sideris TaxID=1016849 RepID=A0ABR0IZL2_9EURO|nr:hypothetical protein LTR10_020886 [Elasticomyces elasticus]KAK5023401.1 hypothetical protein LTS07_009276 [Exophiala sideris]KAK5028223.1 hypothetical protein LTR13_009211 [Exophiala sideris]KAK5052881.1 hypothetical protein LTR69_009707 [Exophiala sideris]KAK5178492.1 hypothetical protein LTR44_009117 [Eurotiomycetes sp. CCFEE 6388]
MSISSAVEDLKQRFIALRGEWNQEWEAVAQMNPVYLEGYLKMRATAQSKNALSPKVQELISVALAAACTHIHETAVKAHTRAALDAGASEAEIFEAIGTPYQLHGDRLRIKDKFVEARGFWPERFTYLLQMDPIFFEAYTEFSSLSTSSKILEPKVRELIICAIDASTTHLHSIGIRVHMRNALNLGASAEEVIQMLELTSLLGMHGVTTSTPLLFQAVRNGQN